MNLFYVIILIRHREYVFHNSDSHLTMYSVGSHLSGTSSRLVHVISTHPSTQWAAVTTHIGLMIEPPHM